MNERHEKARLDQAAYEKCAKQHEIQERNIEIILSMLADGEPIEKIEMCAGLNPGRIKKLNTDF